MYAHIGDRLIMEGDPARAGLIIGVPHEDGTPPYIVRWLTNGHIAMVSPDQFARIIPAEQAGSRPMSANHGPSPLPTPGQPDWTETCKQEREEA
jgi:Domain of unknown function (DUF1918)